MQMKDYYATLGVTPQTSMEEMKRCYRKLARKYHPDVSKLPEAENNFKEINEAWEVLKDPQKKAQYDQIRAGGGQASKSNVNGAEFNQSESEFSAHDSEQFSDFFNSIFGGQHQGQTSRHAFKAKGNDIHAMLMVPLSIAYHGGVQTIQLQKKVLNVKIPPGVITGSQIRLKEHGGEGFGGGPKGDLYVEIEIAPHPLFTLHQKDVHVKIPITPWEAALGASIAVPTLGGKVNLKIPMGAQSGQKMRLKERGLGKPPGNQYVELQIYTPPAATPEAKALYEQMAKQMAFNPRANLEIGE
jgi:curved DNA-binding protein